MSPASDGRAMADPAEPARPRRRLWARLGAAVLVVIGMLGSCELLQRTEPQASRDVLDAIYAGMKRAPDHPG
jgi:hypothetical protein